MKSGKLGTFHDAIMDRSGGQKLDVQGPRMRVDRIAKLRAANGPRAGEIVYQVRIVSGRNVHEHVLDSPAEVRVFLDGVAAMAATIGAVMIDEGGNELLARVWLAERLKDQARRAR